MFDHYYFHNLEPNPSSSGQQSRSGWGVGVSGVDIQLDSDRNLLRVSQRFQHAPCSPPPSVCQTFFFLIARISHVVAAISLFSKTNNIGGINLTLTIGAYKISFLPMSLQNYRHTVKVYEETAHMFWPRYPRMLKPYFIWNHNVENAFFCPSMTVIRALLTSVYRWKYENRETFFF